MYSPDVSSNMVSLKIVTWFENSEILITLEGNVTGGTIAALDTSTITVPGTCG
jgi:hypothetical protein